MKIAVYDTHVTKKNGGIMHFDIVVSEEIPYEKVLEFGRDYLKGVGQEEQSLSAKECKFCHSLQADRGIEKAIRAHGFHIAEMEGCR
ncbi:MAG: DUF2024 family protein [Candidatus Sumerlaeota bacterium]